MKHFLYEITCAHGCNESGVVQIHDMQTALLLAGQFWHTHFAFDHPAIRFDIVEVTEAEAELHKADCVKSALNGGV